MVNVDKDTITFGLKVASATCLGLYAGGSLYINAVECPANMDHGMEHALQNWQRNYHHASRFAPVINGTATVSAIAHYLLTRGTEQEDISFLIAVACGELNLPISLGILLPINKKLQDQENCKKEGDIYIRSLLEKWNVRHGVRTLVGISTFAYAVYRIAKATN